MNLFIFIAETSLVFAAFAKITEVQPSLWVRCRKIFLNVCVKKTTKGYPIGQPFVTLVAEAGFEPTTFGL